MLVFNQGAWNDVPLPRPLDRSWTRDQQLLYTAVYQKYSAKGLSKEKAAQVAEAYVYKELLPGLKFQKELEALLEKA